MFGSLGVPELIFIFALALLIFGPRKLPEIGRTIGRGLSEFRKASTDLKRSINAEMIEEEMRQTDPRQILREDPAPSARRPGADKAGGKPASSDPPSPSAPPEGSVARSPSGVTTSGSPTPGESPPDGEAAGDSGAGEASGDPEAP